jgi:hypothetical protein
MLKQVQHDGGGSWIASRLTALAMTVTDARHREDREAGRGDPVAHRLVLMDAETSSA